MWFDSARFARTYLVTFWLAVIGLALFVGGAVLIVVADIRPAGPLLFLSGWVISLVSIVASTTSAYRELRASGHGRHYSAMYSGPCSIPSARQYRDYRQLLRSGDDSAESSNSR